jgi:hypothetical protein
VGHRGADGREEGFLAVQDVYEADPRRVVHQEAAGSGRILEEGSAASYTADADVCGFHEAVGVCNCPSCRYRGVPNAASASDGGRDRSRQTSLRIWRT